MANSNQQRSKWQCPEIGPLQFVVGEPVDIERDLRCKKPFVIEMFGTWCGPCIQSIPHLSSIQNKYPEITIISVSISDRLPQLKSFANTKKTEISYRLASDYGAESLAEFESKFKAKGIPHAYVIDHTGIIIYSGHPLEQNFEKAIAYVIQEYKKANLPPPFNVNEHTKDSLTSLSIKELKTALTSLKIDFANFIEKSEFVDALLRLKS